MPRRQEGTNKAGAQKKEHCMYRMRLCKFEMFSFFEFKLLTAATLKIKLLKRHTQARHTPVSEVPEGCILVVLQNTSFSMFRRLRISDETKQMISGPH